MKSRFLSVVALLTLAAATACSGVSAACSNEGGLGSVSIGSSAPPPDHAATVQAWRDKHEADYRRDFVSIAGLHFLDSGTHTVGSAGTNKIVLAAKVPPTIGRLVVEGDSVRLEPVANIEIRQRDAIVTGPIVMKEAGQPPAPEIVIGQVRLVVHLSGDRVSLRVRDPEGEQARSFAGFKWFPIDAAYRVTGRLVRDAESRRMKVLNTLNDVDEYASEGVVEFTLQGQTLRLRPFTTRPKRFYFVFRDASGGEETYKVARFLYSDLQDDGTTILDFNQAYNPPCAFNPYTTCPIPLRENVLGLKILAGERDYGK